MTVAVISRILAAARSNAVSGSLMVKEVRHPVMGCLLYVQRSISFSCP